MTGVATKKATQQAKYCIKIFQYKNIFLKNIYTYILCSYGVYLYIWSFGSSGKNYKHNIYTLSTKVDIYVIMYILPGSCLFKHPADTEQHFHSSTLSTPAIPETVCFEARCITLLERGHYHQGIPFP